jgi:hypothetical protein
MGDEFPGFGFGADTGERAGGNSKANGYDADVARLVQMSAEEYRSVEPDELDRIAQTNGLTINELRLLVDRARTGSGERSAGGSDTGGKSGDAPYGGFGRKSKPSKPVDVSLLKGWTTLKVPPRDWLLGKILTTTSRFELIGPTEVDPVCATVGAAS